jgi:hypothetical protein
MRTKIHITGAPLGFVAAWVLIAAGTVAPARGATPFVYEATVVTDVSLDGKFLHNAEVTISFSGDASTIVQVPNFNSDCFYWLPNGEGSVRIMSDGRHTIAHFAPGQLFASVDQCNLGIGIGSYIGPRGFEPGYPIAFARGSAGNLSFTSNGDALRIASNSSGNAWSCVGFPPTYIGSNGNGDGFCADPTPYPLLTDRGKFFIYMPYTIPPPFPDNYGATLNRGTFSIRAATTE